MRCPTLIGVAATRGAYTARRLHRGGPTDQLIPALRRIWQHTHAESTAALVETLLARDWVDLDPAAHRSRNARVVPGLGYASVGSDRPPWTGSVAGEVTGDLRWLYLIDPDGRAVTVYAATRTGRWLRHSLHDLPVDADGDLFVSQPSILCLTCGALDLVDHAEAPSTTGFGTDTRTRCLRCGATEAFDPMAGWHRRAMAAHNRAPQTPA